MGQEGLWAEYEATWNTECDTDGNTDILELMLFEVFGDKISRDVCQVHDFVIFPVFC